MSILLGLWGGRFPVVLQLGDMFFTEKEPRRKWRNRKWRRDTGESPVHPMDPMAVDSTHTRYLAQTVSPSYFHTCKLVTAYDNIKFSCAANWPWIVSYTWLIENRHSKALSSPNCSALYNSIYTPSQWPTVYPNQYMGCSLAHFSITTQCCVYSLTQVTHCDLSLSQSLAAFFELNTLSSSLPILCCNFQLFNFPSQIFINNILSS